MLKKRAQTSIDSRVINPFTSQWGGYTLIKKNDILIVHVILSGWVCYLLLTQNLLTQHLKKIQSDLFFSPRYYRDQCVECLSWMVKLGSLAMEKVKKKSDKA